MNEELNKLLRALDALDIVLDLEDPYLYEYIIDLLREDVRSAYKKYVQSLQERNPGLPGRGLL